MADIKNAGQLGQEMMALMNAHLEELTKIAEKVEGPEADRVDYVAEVANAAGDLARGLYRITADLISLVSLVAFHAGAPELGIQPGDEIQSR